MERYRSKCAVEMESESAKLSKLPSAVSSPGSCDLTSRVTSKRSRIALLYSVRLSRWTAPILPGLGFAVHARSISFSNQVATARYVAVSGRGLPGGGMEPARSFSMTRSQISAFELACTTSSLSRARQAVRSFSLWQLRHYCSRTARSDGAHCVAARAPGL